MAKSPTLNRLLIKEHSDMGLPFLLRSFLLIITNDKKKERKEERKKERINDSKYS